MSLNKAIEHKKEKRKPYYGCEAIDKSCRCHGSDGWMRANRLYSSLKREGAVNSSIKEWYKEGEVNRTKKREEDEFWDEWFLFCYLDDLFSDLEDF